MKEERHLSWQGYQTQQSMSHVRTLNWEVPVVVFDDADYVYAKEVHRRYPKVPFYLQPGNATPPQVGEFDMQGVLTRLTWLIGKVTADHWHDVTVLPQLHTLLWQNRRGV
jgi:7-carboxy-7-deazaguanine synthase